MAVLQGKLRGARLTVWLQVLFAYSPMGRGDLQIVSAPRELQAFAVGGWEAGRLGAAWAERWQWQTGSGSSLARDVTVDHRLAKWACGLARGPCSKARLGPVGARPTAIWQHKLFHLLGTYQETGHPTNSSRRITHSLNSHQATHSPLTSHLSLLTTHQQTSGRPTLLCTYRRKNGNGMARGARSQSNPSHPAQ